MKVNIKYHPLGGEITPLVETDADFIHTRNFVIDSVTYSEVKKALTVYLPAMPKWIDLQRDTIIIMDKRFADRNPEPYGIYTTDYFGKPVTIWQHQDAKILEGVRV